MKPRHSIEAEWAVIGGLLIDPTKLDDVIEIISPEDFTDPRHVSAYRMLRGMVAAGEPTDVLTLSDRLGGKATAYLGELQINTPGTSNIAAYAKIVRDRAIERRLGDSIQRAQKILEDGGDTRDILNRAQTEILAVEYEIDGQGPAPMADSIAEFIQELDRRAQGEAPGTLTGYQDFDRKTSGLHPGDLCILAGRPSMGKTALAMNIATHVAQTGTVLVFSLEMVREQLISRLVSATTKVPLQRIRTGKLGDDWAKVTEATAVLRDLPIFIDESAGLSILEVAARARKVNRKTPLNLIVVDYLQLLKGKGENRTQEVSDVSSGLKTLAKTLKVPIIALSQLNRGLESRPDKRPVMSDLRESGSIEQDADIIAFLYRDEVYNEQSEYAGYAELAIKKQRNGELGKAWLTFDGGTMTFRTAVPPTTPPRAARPFQKGRKAS